MSKCFVACFGKTACHVELSAASESASMVLARPWVEDGSHIRPVLTAAGEYPEFLADAEGAAFIGAIEFLERRFGLLADQPLPCHTPGNHRKHLDLPLRWTDERPEAATAAQHG